MAEIESESRAGNSVVEDMVQEVSKLTSVKWCDQQIIIFGSIGTSALCNGTRD
jgi:hypothetical protein